MGVFDKIGKAVSKAAVSTGSGVARAAALKKAEVELADLENRYTECYVLIGKRISEVLRSGEEIADVKVNDAFKRILKFDQEKAEKEAIIRELKGAASELSEAEALVAVEEEVEREIKKCRDLMQIGVDTQEDYDRKVAVLRNKVIHFKKLRSLDEALAKSLITEDEFKQKRAAVLGQPVED